MKSKEELKLRQALLTECLEVKSIEFQKIEKLSEKMDKVFEINFISGQLDILKWMLNEK